MADTSFLRELEALRQQRRVPRTVPELTPGGALEQSVHTEIDKRRERIIKTMESRFTELRGHAENTFALAALETRASRDFEQSR